MQQSIISPSPGGALGAPWQVLLGCSPIVRQWLGQMVSEDWPGLYVQEASFIAYLMSQFG